MHEDSTQLNSGPRWQHWTLRYGGALAATGIALWTWFLWPVMHQDPFAVFITAVIISARFFGFGPALLCTAASALALDYFVFASYHLSLRLSANEAERMAVFVLVAILATGLARQRSRAEIRAEQARQHIAAIVESSDDAILSKDMNGIITSWNRGAEQLYGYSAGEAIGQHVSILAPPEQGDEIPAIMKRLLRGGHIQRHQTERVRKDGTRLTVYLSISPLRNRRGEIVGASSIAQDITVQKRTEEALRRNEKLATAGRLAAAIAHEINNPLEAVTNLLYLAGRDPESQQDYLRLAEKEVQRVAAIAQQTLGFVREPSSALPLNVAETLDQVLRLYLPRLVAKRIQVEKHYDIDADIRGFAGELRQLFSNLITNAVDAMGESGRLRVRVARSHEWANGERHRSGVRITIADNGGGIRRNDMAHIFEPFYTTKKDLGTGLGLWLSHGIVQKHGGSIRVRSRTTPGHSGTIFTVFLPSLVETPKAA